MEIKIREPFGGTDDRFKKKCRTFSFAYEHGHMALDHLDNISKEVEGGRSAYIVQLLLEDMERRGMVKISR